MGALAKLGMTAVLFAGITSGMVVSAKDTTFFPPCALRAHPSFQASKLLPASVLCGSLRCKCTNRDGDPCTKGVACASSTKECECEKGGGMCLTKACQNDNGGGERVCYGR